MELHEKVRFDIGVSDHFVEPTVKAILAAARTGEVGDGKIFVLPVEKIYRIRTGEEDQAAVTPVQVAAAGPRREPVAGRGTRAPRRRRTGLARGPWNFRSLLSGDPSPRMSHCPARPRSGAVRPVPVTSPSTAEAARAGAVAARHREAGVAGTVSGRSPRAPGRRRATRSGAAGLAYASGARVDTSHRLAMATSAMRLTRRRRRRSTPTARVRLRRRHELRPGEGHPRPLRRPRVEGRPCTPTGPWQGGKEAGHKVFELHRKK